MQARSGCTRWTEEGIVDVPSSAGAPAASLSDEALERMPCCRTSWDPPESPARLEEEGRVALPLGAVWPLHNTRRREDRLSMEDWVGGWVMVGGGTYFSAASLAASACTCTSKTTMPQEHQHTPERG